MSLRARLIAALIALAAVGLVALAAITYAEQRSFLYERADDQARQAQGAVAHRFGERDGGGPPGGRPPPPPFGGDGGGPGGGGRGGPRGVNLPPGTFGQRLDAEGEVAGSAVTLSYGETALPQPKLPSKLPLGKPFTVDARGSSGLRYRAFALPDRVTGGVVVGAVPLREVDQTLDRLVRVEALVIVGVLALLAALAWWVVRLGLRPLDRIGETAGAIAAGDLSQRVTVADERTEVGRLGLALNAMLGQIERAFAERQASENRLRQFLADASHELRTPLASIRGYAELFRIGAARSTADTEKAMRRIEDESARMGSLVENLLALARLDQLPELARTPVDLGALAADAADDARATAPEREVTVSAEGPVSVLGDASQLRQVLGNLVRNALVHTPEGTALSLAVVPVDADGLVTVTVRDHGPGLPVDDSDVLFERFWRAEGGRERGRGGAGLGLSIVAAIVAAHGGSVSAANAPGGGAIFTVRLPAA